MRHNNNIAMQLAVVGGMGVGFVLQYGIMLVPSPFRKGVYSLSCMVAVL